MSNSGDYDGRLAHRPAISRSQAFLDARHSGVDCDVCGDCYRWVWVDVGCGVLSFLVFGLGWAHLVGKSGVGSGRKLSSE
jgi:hypothetical protein